MQYIVVFEYADAMSGWRWIKQEGYFYGKTRDEAVRKCIDIYGLGVDCEYRIISVEPE